MNFKESKAIYLQIADRICDEVLLGQYREEERIPSVREYAAVVEVNANTVMRSYDYLQSQEVIYNKRGIGYFRLNQVQLTYDFPENTFKGTFVRGLSVYCGGSNLLTISKERKHMELSTGSPQCRNFYAGFKAAF